MMKFLLLLSLLWGFCGCASTPAGDRNTITLPVAHSLSSSGLLSTGEFSGPPDADGVLKKVALRLPKFTEGCYWKAFQKHDVGEKLAWYNGANRLQPLAFHDLNELESGGFFALLHLESGQYLALLPLTGSQTMAWFAVHQERSTLSVYVGNLGSKPVSGNLPMLAWAQADDPYRASYQAWKQVTQCADIGAWVRLRGEKPVPKFLDYLGFATWEQYREQYDAEILIDLIKTIRTSSVPIRWIQIGKGHHDVKAFKGSSMELLNSFDPHPTKFPLGWKPVQATLSDGGVTWMGLFQALSGYPYGIHPENELGALNEHLVLMKNGALQPRNSVDSSNLFYDAMIRSVRDEGHAFIKMDFQTFNLNLYVTSGIDSPVETAINNMRAYQRASQKYLEGTINCMGCNPITFFNGGPSNMIRVSQDYQKGHRPKARRTIHNAYGNIPFLGHVFWGDHDMFHTSDKVSSALMAVAKALSGGTIYLSDRVDNFETSLILPLCYQDGRLLRPRAPAAPLPESLFLDPFLENKAYRVVAPLRNRVAAIALYNLTENPAKNDRGHIIDEKSDQVVRGIITSQDYVHANAMLQPSTRPWALPAEGLIVYDWRARRAQRLDGTYQVALEGFSDHYALLCPIEQGWSVIGRADKYLSSEAVEIVERTSSTLALRLQESGPLAIWTDKLHLVSSPGKCTHQGQGLWIVDLPVGRKDMNVTLQVSQ